MDEKYNIKRLNIRLNIYFNPSTSDDLDDIKTLVEEFVEEDKYQETANNIYQLVRNPQFLCKGLNRSYILDAFEEAHAIIVLSNNIANNVFAFAIVQFDEDTNSLYIDVICTHVGIKGAGESLLLYLEQMCVKLFIETIVLTSVKNAIGFYEKYGYKKADVLCDNMCLMKKRVK